MAALGLARKRGQACWRSRLGQEGCSAHHNSSRSLWYIWGHGIPSLRELVPTFSYVEEPHLTCFTRNMYFALNNGGPAAWFWSYIIVLAGVLCQAATFGEMASIQPIAGAQYYWTWNFSPPSCRRFLTWMQGWMTWTGWCIPARAAFVSRKDLLTLVSFLRICGSSCQLSQRQHARAGGHDPAHTSQL